MINKLISRWWLTNKDQQYPIPTQMTTRDGSISSLIGKIPQAPDVVRGRMAAAGSGESDGGSTARHETRGPPETRHHEEDSGGGRNGRSFLLIVCGTGLRKLWRRRREHADWTGTRAAGQAREGFAWWGGGVGTSQPKVVPMRCLA